MTAPDHAAVERGLRAAITAAGFERVALNRHLMERTAERDAALARAEAAEAEHSRLFVEAEAIRIERDALRDGMTQMAEGQWSYHTFRARARALLSPEPPAVKDAT